MTGPNGEDDELTPGSTPPPADGEPADEAPASAPAPATPAPATPAPATPAPATPAPKPDPARTIPFAERVPPKPPGRRRSLGERIRQSRRYAALVPARSLVASFNFAFEGIIFTLATQRNMRIHYCASVVAMIACILLGVERVEFALVIFAASFVIAAEMLNTAVEATIDVATTSFNPLAKVAKDVAAGAVLIAGFNAICTAYLVFSPRITDPSARALVAVRDTPVHITFVALVITFLGTVALKVITGRRGTPLRGGFPSGHAAIAFAAWMAITFVTAHADYATLASSLAFLLALLVSHTRVESGVHTWGEVAAGALFGSLTTLIIFQIAIAAR